MRRLACSVACLLRFQPACDCACALQVASIPIAIEIVCTTTLALGSRQLSAYGAIVTRLQSIEEMAGMNMLCSDKTGAWAGGMSLHFESAVPAGAGGAGG